jgi:hypothetical protein
VSRLKTVIRRLVPLVLVAFAAGAIAAHADNKQKPAPQPAPTAATPATPRVVFTKFAAACKPARNQPAPATTPPSQALLDAFAVLQRERRPEDALTPDALNALKARRLTPVSPDSARLLRSGPGDARAWVVPVPDVSGPFPLVCKAKAAKPREGLAVVATGGAAAGGGGALDDLVRGRAPASVETCAGPNHDMLSVSGIVPNGVAAVFLTAPDGTATRADVKDNGYQFLIPSPKTVGQRYIVWTGGDGTPHVQPIAAFGAVPAAACKRVTSTAFAKAPRVTPAAFGLCATPTPIAFPVPAVRRPKGSRIQVEPPLFVGGCAAPPPVLVLPGGRPPLAVPVRPATPKKHR